MMTSKQLLDALVKGPVTVLFEKADGTERQMLCTLNESVVPETKNSGRKTNEEVRTVFDLDLNQWRSFRYDRVISWVEATWTETATSPK